MPPDARPLAGHVAVVAGATRGAGRGIASMLGEAGATVYCTGRSTRDHPPAAGTYAGRPETIDETAAMVTTRGGAGIAVRVDHLVPEQVEALFARVRAEQGAARRARQRHLGGRDSRLETVLGAAKDQSSTSCRSSSAKGFRSSRRGTGTCR